MKVGERGQITIPKEIRDKFGFSPHTEVEFRLVNGAVVLRKVRRELPLRKWKGYCGKRFKAMGYSSVDQFIEDIRGR
jgi:AbrB family looped-hinge helix DNA binding protein